MEREDIDAVMDIETASFPSPWTKGMFYETLSSPVSEAFVLTGEGVVEGYIVSYMAHDEAHVMNIAVSPEVRRKGNAGALLDFSIARFRNHGACDVYLEVREGNEPAKALYGRYGFQAIGRRKKYYTETGEDALVMWLSIC